MRLEKNPGILIRKEFRKFGTDIDFQIIVSNKIFAAKAKKTLEIAEKKCDEIEKKFSRFDSNSELMMFNASLGKLMIASEMFLFLANSALKYYDKTGYQFDPRIINELENAGYDVDFKSINSVKDLRGLCTSREIIVDFKRSLHEDLIIEGDKIIFNQRMDFTGIVKGFTVDYISKMFRIDGWENFLVDCGGDMFFSGSDQNGNPWYIDIEGIPYENLMLSLSGFGVATSGIASRKWEVNGKRYHHLIDPKNIGNYCFDLKSVTVVDKRTEMADVLAKTLYIAGKEKAKVIANEKKIATAIIDYKGNTWISNGLKKYLFKKNE